MTVCSRCLNNDRKCAGYGIRLQWPETAYATSQGREARKQISEQIRFSRKGALQAFSRSYLFASYHS